MMTPSFKRSSLMLLSYYPILFFSYSHYFITATFSSLANFVSAVYYFRLPLSCSIWFSRCIISDFIEAFQTLSRLSCSRTSSSFLYNIDSRELQLSATYEISVSSFSISFLVSSLRLVWNLNWFSNEATFLFNYAFSSVIVCSDLSTSLCSVSSIIILFSSFSIVNY